MSARVFRSLLTFVVALVIAEASVAQTDEAGNSGWYAGLHAGLAFTPDLVNESGIFFLGSTPYGYVDRLTTNTGFGVGGFVGHKLPVGVRLEIEVAYRRNSLDEAIDYSQYWNYNRRGSVDGRISSVAYLFNCFYELDAGSGFMPYVGLGLGGATKFLDCGGFCFGLQAEEDRATDFAAQFGAGVAYALTPKTVLSFDYRYFDSFEADITIFSAELDFDYRNHNIMLGLRQHF